MEKTIANLTNLAALPKNIYHEIARYVSNASLSFFSMTDKRALKYTLPALIKRKDAFLQVKLAAAGGANTYLYHADRLYVCGAINNNQPESCSDTFTAMQLPGKVKQVTAGGSHTLILTEDNQLWGWGSNIYGQLGLGHKERCNTLNAVSSLSGRIKQVLAGWNHSLILMEDDQLWACGNNAYGQLGIGHIKTCYSLMKVPLPGKLKQVIAGGSHTLVLTDDNQLWACGANRYGQLGLGHNENCNRLTQVPLPGKLKQIFAGALHTIVLTEDNQLWACGQNLNGQLGLGHKENRNTLTAMPFRGMPKQVVAGGNHTLIITEDNLLWACGYNMYGQLGLEHKENRHTLTAIPLPFPVIQALVGANHTIIKTEDGRVWVCGQNHCGQLGLGHKEHCATFTLVKKLPTTFPQYDCIQSYFYSSQLVKDPKLISQKADAMQSAKYQSDGQPMLKRMRYQ